MIPFTIDHWFRADADTRLIILDAVLERLPSGYREHGQRSGVFPQFVHEESGVVFNAILGGQALFGMTERRWQRAMAMRAMWSLDGDVRWAAELISPAREVVVDAALVATATLGARVLERFGIARERLNEVGFERTQLHAVLQNVTRLGWRAPSEAEWEFALRMSAGDVTDGGSPTEEALARRVTMGDRYELCRDNFHPTLDGYPREGSRGDGHEVVRGRTEVLVRGTSSAAWADALWPGRRRLADVSGHIAFRPWVSLIG